MSDSHMNEANPETSRRYGASDDPAYDAGRRAASQRWLLIVIGVVAIIAGALAIVMPLIGTITAAFVAGAALLITGIAGLFTAFRRGEGWHMASAFILSLLSIAAGVLIFLQPVAGVLALTTLVIAWFAASGILRIYYGAKNMSDGGGWMVAVGALSLVLAVLLWFGLPFSATWVLGVLLGVDLLLWGSLMIAFATRIKRHGPEAVA